MKFYVTRIMPDGREGIGSNCWFMEYANVENVVRFGLKKPGIPPGQFHIYYIRPSGALSTLYNTAYKRA